MDYRSLYLHFECGVWMYQTKAVFQVKEDILQTIKKSEEINMKFVAPRAIVFVLLYACTRAHSIFYYKSILMNLHIQVIEH